MKKGGAGGASTLTGLHFEKEKDLSKLLSGKKGYEVKDDEVGKAVYFENELVANVYSQHKFYKFLKLRKINWKSKISKKLLPDNALDVIVNDTLFIIEVKSQQVDGSVDEKLQTCDFKKKEYQSLLADLNVEIEYIYVLADWFKNPKYKDVLDYIISVNCHYYFDSIPLQELGLPVAEDI